MWQAQGKQIANEDLKKLLQSIWCDILEAYVKPKSNAPVTSIPLKPAREHEILDPDDYSRYKVVLHCSYCENNWQSGFGYGGEPYVAAFEAGWRKLGGTWDKSKCPSCSAACSVQNKPGRSVV